METVMLHSFTPVPLLGPVFTICRDYPQKARHLVYLKTLVTGVTATLTDFAMRGPGERAFDRQQHHADWGAMGC
ncbi:MAG: hypothetical protein Q7T28_12590 [Cypionkella sp.]|nr:hypothetical protein [Cypionkella sp.]